MKTKHIIVGLSVIACLSILAADRVGIWTKNVRTVETRRVKRVITEYDDVGMLTTLQVIYSKTTSDTNGVFIGSIVEQMTWTTNMISDLPDSTFKTAMGNRWQSADNIPETVVVLWNHPEWGPQ